MSPVLAHNTSPRPLQFQTSLYWVACALRFLYGAAFLRLLTTIQHHDLPEVTTAILLATFVCGMAAGAGIDRLVSLRFGRQFATVYSGGLLVVGLLLLQSSSQSAGLMIAALMIGCGYLGDWSSLSTAVRLAFPGLGRWNALRWYHVCLPAGMTVGACLPDDGTTFVVVAVALVVVRMITIEFPRNWESPVDVSAVSHSSVHNESAVEGTPQVALRDSSIADSTPELDDSVCDAEECCGGSTQAFRPTSFLHGVIFATVGYSLLWGFLPTVMQVWPSTGHIAAIGGGMWFGPLLLISAAPRVGYTIITMSFLLLSLPAISLPLWVNADSWMSWPAALACGVFAGGAASGISGMIGELTAERPTDSGRTRTIYTSLFATTIIMLFVSGLHWFVEPALVFGAWASICMIGIMAVKKIPSPVISTTGSEATDPQTNEELNDIVAALNHQ